MELKKIRIPSAEGNQLTIYLKKRTECVDELHHIKKKYEEAILNKQAITMEMMKITDRLNVYENR
jgi:hypothetical protein